nr:XRE family transcriptional regulator [Candidatus Freyarchaeota archaeon]
MRTPCEVMNKFYLPSIRAMIAKELSETYNCTQMKIAEWLGVTQAAISQYLSSKRAVAEQMLKTRPAVNEFVREITAKLMNGEEEKVNMTKEMCKLCSTLKLCEAYGIPRSYQTVRYR